MATIGCSAGSMGSGMGVGDAVTGARLISLAPQKMILNPTRTYGAESKQSQVGEHRETHGKNKE